MNSNTTPQLLPIEKSNIDIINTIKSNVILLLSNRGFINPDNISKYTKNILSSHNDDDEYLINLDFSSNFNTSIPNKKIYLKFIHDDIKSINPTSVLGKFLQKYNSDFKFIVLDDISQKIEQELFKSDNFSIIFKKNELLSNLVDHDIVPKHIMLSKDLADKVLIAYNAKKINMPLISRADPVAKYYGMKPNDICKILRPSTLTTFVPFYRICVDAKILKTKT
jgi:DNA-directed RNA polymerase subunit H (RpoH/RPB5)